MTPPPSRTSAFAVIVTTVLFFLTPSTWAEDGLPNFAHVTDMLYRGGQPSWAGLSALRGMGVGIIVNFREESAATAAEQREVESLGMRYVAIPWNGIHEPSNIQVVQFLDLVRNNPQARVFVHCQRGADRTGTMIAAYRIAVEHKSIAEAVSEMHQFHYAHFLLPHLERYVASLPSLLKTNALFVAYVPIPHAPIPDAPRPNPLSTASIAAAVTAN